MNTTEAAGLAAELRKAAQDLLLCVNVIVGRSNPWPLTCCGIFRGGWSCWPCVWRRAPSPICHPEWPQWNAPGADHFQALLERQRWRLERRSERNSS